MAGRQGPSERYAPLGLSFPPLPRRAPFRSRSRGRLRRSDGPCRPVMFRWLQLMMNHFRDWPCQYDIDLNKKGEWYCGKLRCLSKTWLHLLDKSTRILWDIHVVWTRAIWFSTLLATAVLYYILTIRKLANSTNVKRQVRKGVLAWAFGRSIHIIYWYTKNYNKKTKPTNVKRVENYSHPRKHNRVENYTHT